MNVLSEYKNPSVTVVNEQKAWFPPLSVRPHETLQARCLKNKQTTGTRFPPEMSITMLVFIIYHGCMFFATTRPLCSNVVGVSGL